MSVELLGSIDADGKCTMCGGDGTRGGCPSCANGRATLPHRDLKYSHSERIAELEKAFAVLVVRVAEMECDVATLRAQVPPPVYSSIIPESVATRDQMRQSNAEHVDRARAWGEAMAHGDRGHVGDVTMRGGLEKLRR